MSNLTMMRRMQVAAGLALLVAASAAQAQWMWIDEKGLKQVSDRPPPASVPAKKILKAPGAMMDDAPAPVEAKASAPASAPSKGMTLAEREADYRKRMADKGEQDKKMAADEAKKAQKAAACQAARENKEALESGVKLRVGAGRREFMDDQQRAQKTVATASFLSANCQ